MRRQYVALDIAKFIAACLIVILHTAPFGSYSKALTFGLRNIVTVVAVPFFFAVSGFLFFEKYESLENKDKFDYAKKYLLRILFMYLFWSAVYFVFVVIKWLRKGFSFELVLEYVKDFFFEGSYLTIWFLPALLVAVFLVAFLRKFFTYKIILIIAGIFYLFTLGGTQYWGLTQRIPVVNSIYNAYYSFFDTMKNGVLFGFIFVSLGGGASRVKDKIRISKALNILLIAICWILIAVEALIPYLFNFSNISCDTTLMTLPITFLLLLLCININISENKISVIMRKYSTLIFLTQRIPMSIIELFLADTILYTNSLLFFVVVSLSTVLISTAYYLVAEKYCKFLKRFY